MGRVLSDKPIGEVERECPHCHYLIAYHPSEVVDYRDPDEGEHVRYVACPQCQKTINLPPKQVELDEFDFI